MPELLPKMMKNIWEGKYSKEERKEEAEAVSRGFSCCGRSTFKMALQVPLSV